MLVRGVMAAVVLAALPGCSWFREPPAQGITTGATVVYTGSPGSEVFSVCDKGNLIYLTRSNPQVAVIKDGCNPNLGGPGHPGPAALAAASERTLPPLIPQPFIVHIVPAPQAAPLPAATQFQAAPGMVESHDTRLPIVIQVQPVPAPQAPECPPAPAPKGKPAPKAKPCP